MRIVLLTIVLAAGAGCASSPRGMTEPSGTPAIKERPRSTATISMIEPAPGAVITSDRLRIRLELTGGRVILETKTALKPDEGHIHVLLDGKTVSMTYGLEQDVAVAKGPHLLQAEYVAADHFPFNPRVIVAATIVVR